MPVIGILNYKPEMTLLFDQSRTCLQNKMRKGHAPSSKLLNVNNALAC